MKLREAAQEFDDAGREIAVTGDKAFVPLKLDPKTKEPLTQKTFDSVRHVLACTLDDLRFLNKWRELNHDSDKTIAFLALDEKQAKKTLRKLSRLMEEDRYIEALADVPTQAWIKAHHVLNVKSGDLDESKRDSLKELSKILGLYKQTSVSIEQNIFNLPKMSPEHEAQVRELADKILEAEIVGEAA